MNDQDKRIPALEQEVQGIKGQLDRYKGFIGGIVLTVSAVVTVITLFFNWIKH